MRVRTNVDLFAEYQFLLLDAYAKKTNSDSRK